MVVMKLEVKESSEKRSSRQLFPTPAAHAEGHHHVFVHGSKQHLKGKHLPTTSRTAVANQKKLDQHCMKE